MVLLKAMTDETDEDTLSAYLSLSAERIMNRLYPFGASLTELPDRYSSVQVQVAAYLLNKRGAEGESAHSENGVSRSYENGDIPYTLLREVTPFVSVLSTDATASEVEP